MNQKQIVSTIVSLFGVILFAAAVPELQAQRSLYSDVKAHRQGDVITVILTENIHGTSSVDARSQSRTNGRAASGVSGSMLPVDAVFGASAELDFNSDERALANQRQLLSGTLSVQIREIYQNGNYLIDGSRSTEISGETYRMDLKGIVRPEDINDVNEVLSYRIADAQITYQSKGDGLSGMTRKRGFERRLLWGILGVATGVTAVMAIQ